jgi:TM2 domain-containing membrane protein YozV
MNDQQLYTRFPNLTPEEFVLIQNITKDMTAAQQQQFIMIYGSKRKDQQTLLILAAIGFIGPAGIHRFVVGNIGLGILYLFTLGLCFVGTIIDMVNIKDIAFQYNQKQALEAATMVSMMR